MKKTVWILLFVLILMPIASAKAAEPFVSAKSAILYDPLTERVIYEKMPHMRMPMASTTKIMTAYTALQLYDPNSIFTVRPEWTGIEGSSMYLKAGEEMTIRDLLYGLMLMSGNDAAQAAAGICTGEARDFVELMNINASRLGMKDTNFNNPSGLDGEDHRSTAYDMARLTAAAMKNELFREIVSTEITEAAGRYMKNHNKLLSMYDGACGVKTGYTKRSGRCLVTAAERSGRMLIAVTLSAPDDWNDHIRMYDSAFGAASEVTLLESGKVADIDIISGLEGKCGVYADRDFSALLFKDENAGIKIYGPKMVYAPVKTGEKYGRAAIVIDGREIGYRDLFFEKDIEAEAPKEPQEGFWGWLGRKIFGM